MLERLRTALADRYRVDRELGAGGMATVYLAEDLKHHRKVAIKVLRPELASVLGPERFLREIEIAAQLQHPHILAMHDSGEADGLLYYVMPFVEGESLAARIAREGPLPTDQALRILRELADALSYAHGKGLVHRDIKPDNVLLSGNHALIADFGIARAFHDAAGGERLTATGMALGTPAYMAPEQASGEGTDHRADLYAVGVVAYEMLAGEPPFRGRTAQMVVAAHLTETPAPLSKYRPSLPPPLVALVQRCMEKHPADRVQSAAELLQLLEGVSLGSGGYAPTGAAPMAHSPVAPSTQRVALLFAGASLVVLAAAYGLMLGLGLPDWVVPAAAVLLLIGLPVVLTTSRLEHRRPAGAAPHRLFSWRRALTAGAVAFGVLGLAVAAYMAMRLLGIGPVGTLVASGRLGDHPRIILADFTDRTNDPGLAAAVTEAFRVDLGQSSVVELVQGDGLNEAFQRMERERPAVISESVAREVATREGVRAVVSGEINAVGGSYVLSARVIDAETGDVLVPLRETATDSTAIIPAVDKLSRRVRERIGESLRQIRASPALELVTTASLPALRKYSQGTRAIDAGELDQGIALFKEAIELDTAFAAAYRSLATTLSNLGVDRALAASARKRSYQFRDRLTERERLWTEGSYFMGIQELDRARTAYETLLGVEPDSGRVLNNLGVVNILDRRPDEALDYYERALAFVPEQSNANFNVVATSLELGRVERARAVRARFDSLRPGHVVGTGLQWMIGWATGEYDSAAAALERLAAIGNNATGPIVLSGRIWLAQLKGQPSRGLPALAESERRALAGRQVREHLLAVLQVATYEAVVLERPREARRRVEAALERFPLAAFEPFDRPYAELALFYARAGQPARARQLLADFEREVPSELHAQVRVATNLATAYTTLAEGKPEAAVGAFREADIGMCKVCALPGLSQAWREVGNQDSVLAVLERYLALPDDDRAFVDPLERAGALARLGELYELRGDTAKAISYNAQFLDLWRDADPVFAPVLERVRERQRRLTAEGR